MLSDEELWELIGEKIQIELDPKRQKNNDVAIGNLVTRDPVSHCFLLANIENNKCESLEWIPEWAVKSIRKIDGFSVDADVFDKILNDSEQIDESEDQIIARARKVIDYLKSHHLDVTEKTDGVFVIAGAVRFERPYRPSNFYCDIPIVLKRILKLVEEIN